jgi:hypothetical protein
LSLKPDADVLTVSTEVVQVFAVRYRLERAVNRIAAQRDLPLGRTPPSPVPHAICSAALHGGEVSDAKTSFVRRVAPELLATLKAMSE